MPKKIVLKIKPMSQPQQPEQPPEIEAVPSPEPVEPPVVEEKREEPMTVEQQPSMPDKSLEEILQLYDELMKEIERIKLSEKNFVTYCKNAEQLTPKLIKGILARFAEKRNAVLEKSVPVLEKLKTLREDIGSEFAKIEEELIWSSIELNTMQLEAGKGGGKNVGLKEELEARIPELRKKLAELRNRLKTVDDVIKQLTDLPKTIVDMTSNKEEAAKLLEEIKKKLMLTHGPRAEAFARAEIEKIAQQESIPREYATILLWRHLSTR